MFRILDREKIYGTAFVIENRHYTRNPQQKQYKSCDPRLPRRVLVLERMAIECGPDNAAESESHSQSRYQQSKDTVHVCILDGWHGATSMLHEASAIQRF